MLQLNFPTIPLPSVPRLVNEQQASFEFIDATVMFTDIQDSTGLATLLGLMGTVHFLRQHMQLAQRIVRNNNGTVVDLTGDGIFAVWPAAGVKRERIAKQALVAAVDLSNEFAEANAKRRTAGLPYRRLRIGLHSGEVALEQRVNGVPPLLYGVTVHQARKIEEAGKMVDAGDKDVVMMVSRRTLLLAYNAIGEHEDGKTAQLPCGGVEKCPVLSNKFHAARLTDAIARHKTGKSTIPWNQRKALVCDCCPVLIDPFSMSIVNRPGIAGGCLV